MMVLQKFNRKTAVIKAVIFASIMVCNLYAGAWGKTGHRAIAEIGYNQLDRNAKKKIAKILGDSYLPLFATYADDIRSDHENPMGKLPHYVNMDMDETYEAATKSEQGDLVTVFNEMVATVKDPKAAREDKVAALKFIIHLVGDAHQPMHIGLAEDLGGNKVDVTWFGEKTNLHYLWDEDMIDYSHLSYTELARFAGEPAPEEMKTLLNSSVADWVNETHEYTKMIYNNLGDKKYSYAYYYQFSPIFLEQIQKAGFRLGNFLNQLMKDV